MLATPSCTHVMRPSLAIAMPATQDRSTMLRMVDTIDDGRVPLPIKNATAVEPAPPKSKMVGTGRKL